MKKQNLFIAVTMSAIVFSCTKEKIETSQATETAGTSESITVKSPGLVINTLNIGLLGRYEFDGNLKDTTGKLEDGYSTLSRVPAVYTTNRKGQINKAIRFNGKYGVDLFDIPATPDGCSVSLWEKSDTIPVFWLSMLSSWKGFYIQQIGNKVNCSFWNGIVGSMQEVESTIDNKWHHMVATRDNSVMKFYIDGILIGSSLTPVGGGPYFSVNNYLVGHDGPNYWKGGIDDFRFYKRVLTSSEVTQLANL